MCDSIFNNIENLTFHELSLHHFLYYYQVVRECCENYTYLFPGVPNNQFTASSSFTYESPIVGTPEKSRLDSTYTIGSSYGAWVAENNAENWIQVILWKSLNFQRFLS